MQPRVRAPEFPQNLTWLNTDHPLFLKDLKGQIVLLDFWTYCCINCLHVLPDLKYLEQKYPNSLTVIGVHSAKFDNEKEPENIRQAVWRHELQHPVIVDSNWQIWEQYAVKAWPTLILIDPQGYVISTLSGEGNRETLDQLIAQMIQDQAKGTINFQKLALTLEKHPKPEATPLAFPGKVLADEVGDRLFVADSAHHRLIISTLAGQVLQIIGTGKSGLCNGAFNKVQFSSPQGMSLDAKKQILYVADTENHCLRQIDLNKQEVTTLAGTGKQSSKIKPHRGLATETDLNSPWDVEKIGNRLLIAMAGSHQIWELSLETGIICTYAGMGAEACLDGPLTEAAFAQPSGLTTDGRELYVADSEVSSVRAVGLIDNLPVRTICGSGDLFSFGDLDGHGLNVRMQHCLGIEYTQNYLWVADTYNHKIKRVDPRTGDCHTMLGSKAGYLDGQSTKARFAEPSGLSASSAHLYVADTNNHAIRHIALDTLEVTTLTFSGLSAPGVCLPTT